MKLVVTEKNDAAEKIANLLATQKPKKDKVYNTPVYRFKVGGEEWVTIGLRGHILEPDFTPQLIYKKKGGWSGITVEGEAVPAPVPESLPTPPWPRRRKPFIEDGIDLKGWKMEALPYLSYAPVEKLPKERDIIRSLKNLAKKADSIVIATDFDREGELIGADALSCCREVNAQAPVSRARYSAFTKAEIEGAFNNLVEMDMNLAAAGGSRQDIDLIWGATLTRFLTIVRFAGYGNVRSAGRVQTPTLALVVQKERERQAFVPQDYWVITGAFGQDPDAFRAGHATAKFKSEAEANQVMQNVEGATQARVEAVEKKTRTQRPPVPFNTTSLMAAASAEGLTPARTMRLAESLYMSGYISYPRVDNTVYPASLNLADVVRTISANPAYTEYCNYLLALGRLTPTRGNKETTDHPPIYPTAAATPEKLDAASYKLYNLIARRFLATLSAPAKVEGTKVSLMVQGPAAAQPEKFTAKGDVLVAPGYRAIYPYGSKKDEQLPALAEGDVIHFGGAQCEKKQTQPPARYTQGKLIQEMEKRGLGTKSTRHSIIERLFAVKYLLNNPIEPSQLGLAVIDALDKFAPHITHAEMTSQLEEGMTSIAEGEATREGVVLDSRNLLAAELENLMPNAEEISDALSDAVAADAYVGKCPQCGKDLQIRYSNKTHSSFIGCSGWPDCEVIYPLPKGKIEVAPEACPVCGMPQIKVTAFRSKPRIDCIDPACPTNVEEDVVVGKCHVCAEAGKDFNLVAHKNPRTLKRFIRCENYDECETGYPLPPTGKISATEERCEHCGAPMVVVTTQRGPWKLCPNFKCPGKEEEKAKKSSGSRGAARGAGRGAKKTASTRGTARSTKKPATKKAAKKK